MIDNAALKKIFTRYFTESYKLTFEDTKIKSKHLIILRDNKGNVTNITKNYPHSVANHQDKLKVNLIINEIEEFIEGKRSIY